MKAVTPSRFLRARVQVAFAAVAIVVSATRAPSLSAQANSKGLFWLSGSAGVMQYDFSGLGSTAMGAARLDVRLASAVLIEPGVAYAIIKQDFAPTTKLLMPEVQLHLALPTPYVAPFVGVGVGRAIRLNRSQRTGNRNEQSLSAAGGFRVRINEYFGARAELRVRTLGDYFSSSTIEWSAGVSWRL